MSGALPRAPEFTLDSLVQHLKSLQGKRNADETAVLVADIVRKARDGLEHFGNDLEGFLLQCDGLEGGTPALVTGIRVIYDVAVASNVESRIDRSVEILKHHFDEKKFEASHLKFCYDQFVPLVRSVAEYCNERKKEPVVGFDILLAALQLLRENEDNVVSSLHGYFLQLCSQTGVYSAGIPFIYDHIKGVLNEAPISLDFGEYMAARQKPAVIVYVETKYVIKYLYYSAVLLIQVGELRKAKIFLENCITTPCSTFYQEQMSAFKKFHLVCLILYGKLNIPQTRTPAVMRNWKASHSTVYTKLVTEVTESTCTAAKIIAVKDEFAQKLREDGNYELVQTLIEVLKKKPVLKVAKSYSSITLDNLMRRSNLSETEVLTVLQSLKDSGELVPLVDMSTRIVNLTIPQKHILKEEIDRQLLRLEYVAHETDRLDLLSQIHPNLLVRMMKGSGISYFPDDEGLSMSNNPLDFPST